MKLKDIKAINLKKPKDCPVCLKGKLYETGTAYCCNKCEYLIKKETLR